MAKPGRKIEGEEPKRNRFTILFTDSELQALEAMASKSVRSISFMVRAALEEKYPRIFKAVK
jgi:hypothetical protein